MLETQPRNYVVIHHQTGADPAPWESLLRTALLRNMWVVDADSVLTDLAAVMDAEGAEQLEGFFRTVFVTDEDACEAVTDYIDARPELGVRYELFVDGMLQGHAIELPPYARRQPALAVKPLSA